MDDQSNDQEDDWSVPVGRFMKNKKKESPERIMARLLRKIVAEAGALGELKYRRTVVEDEMKQIGVGSASLKRKTGRTTEHRESVREHRQWLARMRFLLQEENEQLGRLTSEMQAQLGETVELLEKSTYGVARPLRRPNPYVLSVRS